MNNPTQPLDAEIDEPTIDWLIDQIAPNSGNSPLLNFNKQRLRDSIARETTAAELRGMQRAKSRVLRRTEIPSDAKNPTRDETVILGEMIADIIQGDIATLQATINVDDQKEDV